MCSSAPSNFPLGMEGRGGAKGLPGAPSDRESWGLKSEGRAGGCP